MNFIFLNENELRTQNPHHALHVKEKIESFNNFPEGWHFGEGVKFQEDILQQAKDLISFLNNNFFIKFDAFPGFNGEVMVTSYPKNWYFEIIIEPGGHYKLVIENEKEEEIFSHGTQDFYELKGIIYHKSRKLLWSGSESSPSIIMIKPGEGSIVSHLKTQAEKEEYQYMMNSVGWKLPAGIANTSASTTGKSLQILSYSGG